MASYKEHCAECKEKLGKDYSVVHRWLDEFFCKMGWHERHRCVRHHLKGIEEVRKMWGDEAAEAARLHISTDFYGYVPKDVNDVQAWFIGVVHLPNVENKDGIRYK